MHIILINLPKDGEVRDVATPDYLLYDFMNYPPLGLLAIAANVDRRHTVEIIDAPTYGMDIDDVVNSIVAKRPDVVGLSVVTRRLYPFYEISKRIKECLPDTFMIAGGPHINVYPKETLRLRTVDAVLSGYGEKSFPLLINSLLQRKEIPYLWQTVPGLFFYTGEEIKENPPFDVPENIDDLPFPNRKLIRLEDYYSAADRMSMTTMYTSRGCPFRCTFCDVGEKTFRYRSHRRIVDEFEHIASLGIKEIHIFDDTFNVSRERIIDMCKEIIKRDVKISWSARMRVVPFDREMAVLMKQAGCRRLHVGVEAFDDNILHLINKNITTQQIVEFFTLCNELSIDTLAYLIVGFSEETPEYRDALYKQLKKLKATYIYINILYPTAKSFLYSEMLKDGVYQKDFWQEFVAHPTRDFELPICRTEDLQKELINLVDTIHRRFYLSPRFIINDLKRDMNLKMLGLKVKIALKLIMGMLRPRAQVSRTSIKNKY